MSSVCGMMKEANRRNIRRQLGGLNIAEGITDMMKRRGKTSNQDAISSISKSSFIYELGRNETLAAHGEKKRRAEQLSLGSSVSS
jgi:hypothetical protein